MSKQRLVLAAFSLALLVAIPAQEAHSQPLTVSYQDNLITVRCSDATLVRVFEEIKSATGLELFLEDPIKGKRLTADIEAQPLHLALERLLEGVGVNYAMMFDRQDWQRVDKIFIGAGGGPVASAQPPPGASARRGRGRQPTPAVEESYYEDDMDDGDNIDDAENVDDGGELEDDASAPAQDILPPPPAFPRSSFTPGLESAPAPFGQERPATTTPSSPNPATQPPAYYPFTDQFGRPIPVPTNPNQQQEEQNQQEQQ